MAAHIRLARGVEDHPHWSNAVLVVLLFAVLLTAGPPTQWFS